MIENTPITLKTNKPFIYFPEVSNVQRGSVAELGSLLLPACTVLVARKDSSLVVRTNQQPRIISEDIENTLK